MDWMATLATAIAVLRLCLIFGGMWMLLRSIARSGILLDYQRKCFSAAGIIYLLGLMPQSLLLLLVNSELENYMLDNGYLCLAQNLACMIAAALHTVIFLRWIVDSILGQQSDRVNCVTSLLKSKTFGTFLQAYVAFFIPFRSIFFCKDDMNSFYTDVASKAEGITTSYWTMSPMDNPSHVVRLQLLLCESSLDERDIWSFLLTSYSFVLFTTPLVYWSLKALFHRRITCPLTDSEEDSEKGEQQAIWWEQEVNIQRLLSTSITVWFHLIQPILFSIHREHFVDFGTHLLLTICVFIPWTHSEQEYNPLHTWV